MKSFEEIQKRIGVIGFDGQEKYSFLFGPKGLLIDQREKEEIEEIGKLAVSFLQKVDLWYREMMNDSGGDWWLSRIQKGVPREYINFSLSSDLPQAMMIDTVWTKDGWRIVEIDTTNRNAFGYPLIMRYLYNLPSIWKGIDQDWLEAGWNGVTQIMADHQRFYEPYFRFFLSRLRGNLVPEKELGDWLDKNNFLFVGPNLLDLPIMYKSKPHMEKLFQLAQWSRVAMPPKHYLSSKALLTLPWETESFQDDPIIKYLPKGRLISKSRPLPESDYFVKLLQAGGAHGTYFNDRAQLDKFHSSKKPQAIWQEALPIMARPVTYYNEDGALKEGEFNVRVSVFVNPKGEVVDADVTALEGKIVHGAKKAVLTVPVFE